MEVSTKALAVLSVVVMGIVAGNFGCPSSCVCVNRNGLKEVICYKKGLTQLPVGIPLDTNKLVLARNQISSLQQRAFHEMSNLLEIDISYNSLRNITDGVFAIQSLKTLKLHENSIERISENALQGCPNLQKLSLVNNKLISLPENVFSGLRSLTSLNLGKNQLTELPNSLFRDLRNLQFLYLNHNKMTLVSNELLKEQTDQIYLDFRHNEIKAIEDRAFSAMSSTLKNLMLDNNNMTTFPKDALTGLKELHSLRITNNKFQSMAVEVRDVLESLPKLSVMAVSGNPFVCSRTLEWFKKWMKEHSIVQDMNQIMCLTPEGVNTPLVSFNFSRLGPITEAPTTVTSTSIVTTVTPKETTLAAETTITTETATQSTTTPNMTRNTNTTEKPTDSSSTTIIISRYSTGSTQMRRTNSSGTTVSTQVPTRAPSISGGPTIWQDTSVSAGSNKTISRAVTTPSGGGESQEKKEQQEKKDLIIAICIAASGLAIIICAAMYCFRKKIFRREKQEKKKNVLRYDRVAFAMT